MSTPIPFIPSTPIPFIPQQVHDILLWVNPVHSFVACSLGCLTFGIINFCGVSIVQLASLIVILHLSIAFLTINGKAILAPNTVTERYFIAFFNYVACIRSFHFFPLGLSVLLF